jgi:RNA polymerase sigma factor (sigma-70 family)
MTTGEPDDKWPGPDDKPVVDEMLRSRDSPHWGHCLNFIQEVVRTKGLSVDAQDDVVQNAMAAVIKHLPDFCYKGRLRNWLGVVVHRHGINEYRRQKLDKQWLIQPNDRTEAPEDVISHVDREVSNSPPTPEELYLRRERAGQIIDVLQDYLNSHKDAEHRRILLQKALFEDYSDKEVARLLCMSPEMVGYIRRSALRHVREHLED